MRKLILIKAAAEIFLKGLNRHKFEKKLMDNIKKVLKDIDYEIISDQNRDFIYGDDLEGIIERVRKVFGVSELCIVTETEADINEIYKLALIEVAESRATTFKIETNRANKNFSMDSMKVNRAVGAYVLDNLEGVSVDVISPQCKVTS